jgi:hypothetical protein
LITGISTRNGMVIILQPGNIILNLFWKTRCLSEFHQSNYKIIIYSALFIGIDHRYITGVSRSLHKSVAGRVVDIPSCFYGYQTLDRRIDIFLPHLLKNFSYLGNITSLLANLWELTSLILVVTSGSLKYINEALRNKRRCSYFCSDGIDSFCLCF